jgi:ribonuclease J
MDIKIHRGENQIGGNIIEIFTETTRILFDVGLDLDDTKNSELPMIDGLFNRKGLDAVFISHYHSDHMGLAYEINQDIPIYMGEKSFCIVKASDRYKNNKSIELGGFLKNKLPIQVGDMLITPYLCDHSAYDSYMLLVESGGKKVLYTGDFRSNGRKKYDWLLKDLPDNIDVLICEGTTLSREEYKVVTEKDLEEEAVKLFRNIKGPIFVLQSSMNIDRIVTMYRSAKRCGRIFLQDLYMLEITSSIMDSIPNPVGFSDVKSFITRPYSNEHFRYQLFSKYGKNKIGKANIVKSNFVMCVRSSMLDYMKSLKNKMSFENGVLIYSFWSGYKSKPEMKLFLEECVSMGLEVVTLHTSGHADKVTIQKLIAKVKPKQIIPIHTENAEWFKDI